MLVPSAKAPAMIIRAIRPAIKRYSSAEIPSSFFAILAKILYLAIAWASFIKAFIKFIAVFFIVLALIVTLIPVKRCLDYECFQNAMRDCRNAKYTNDEIDATWEYEILGLKDNVCSVNVKLFKFVPLKEYIINPQLLDRFLSKLSDSIESDIQKYVQEASLMIKVVQNSSQNAFAVTSGWRTYVYVLFGLQKSLLFSAKKQAGFILLNF